MLKQEQKHAYVQWAVQHKDDHCSRTRFTDESYFTILLVDDHEIQLLKSNK